MRFIQVVLAFVVIFAIGAVAFAYSGIFNVAATEKHDPVTHWLLKTTMRKSIAARAGDVQVPDLSEQEMRLAGINDFDSMCTACHTPPGRQPSPVAQGLNPPAPDLGEAAREEPPEVLFWATKHGIRMTGMPAWGVTHGDQDIWPVIAFLQVLPNLDGDAYKKMLEEAQGHGHHAE